MEDTEVKKEEPKKEVPSATLEVILGPNVYTMKRPNVGQIIDIERMKLKLTDGTHGQMLFGSSQAQQAYMYTDVVAVFSVLLPEIKKKLLVTSLLELPPEQMKQLLEEYEKKVYPWLTALRDALA